MGGGHYDELLEAIFFLVMVWVGGRIAQVVKLSPILGEIAVGILFGPQGLDMVPYAKAPKAAVGAVAAAAPAVTCGGGGSSSYLSIWQLAGSIGVALMIAESGMHLDFSKVGKVGSKSFGVAILGTFLPILCGMAFIAAFGMKVYPVGFSVGASLAPTSVGIALKLLTEAKHLRTDAGQTVVIAAFVDDIFSLIILVILVNLSEGSVTPWGIISPFVYCFLFLGGSALLATKVMPHLADDLLHRIPIYPKATFQLRDEVHLILMLGIIGAFGKIGALIGSELLGTFCAGMLFCNVPHSMTVWHHSMTHFCEWLIRLFFAASVAFSVPVSDMFSSHGTSLLWKGLLVALVPCILAKVVSGTWLHFTTLKASKWTVGWAMVGRAEFAFMVAKVAHESFRCNTTPPERMLSDDGYIITLWALLCAIIFGPIFFKQVLRREMQEYRKEHPADINKMTLKIHARRGTMDNDVLESVEAVLHEHKLDLRNFDRHADMRAGHEDEDEEVFQINVGQRRSEGMDDDEVAEIQHEIEDAVNDHNTDIEIFAPHTPTTEPKPSAPAAKKRPSVELVGAGNNAVSFTEVEDRLETGGEIHYTPEVEEEPHPDEDHNTNRTNFGRRFKIGAFHHRY